MYQIIQKRRIWLTMSSLAVIASVVFLIIWGLNFGIDFTGGSLLEVRFLNERPSIGEVQDAVGDLDLGSLTVQPVGENSMILRFQDTSEGKHQEVMKRLRGLSDSGDVKEGETRESDQNTEDAEGANIEIEGENMDGLEMSTEATGTQADFRLTNYELPTTNIEELRFDSVGPSIGQELKRKSFNAIVFVLAAIVVYIAWVFRKVSKPVASWKYGLTAIIALFHDVMITLGIFAVLGEYWNIEVNTPFVAAILTVLGYSVNDTIVVFDRIRENLPRSNDDFEGTVNTSVNQTITRSINTSLTTLLVLLSIMFFGGSSIRDFVMALSIGVLVGTYSSIFLASPVLVVWEKLKK